MRSKSVPKFNRNYFQDEVHDGDNPNFLNDDYEFVKNYKNYVGDVPMPSEYVGKIISTLFQVKLTRFFSSINVNFGIDAQIKPANKF